MPGFEPELTVLETVVLPLTLHPSIGAPGWIRTSMAEGRQILSLLSIPNSSTGAINSPPNLSFLCQVYEPTTYILHVPVHPHGHI